MLFSDRTLTVRRYEVTAVPACPGRAIVAGRSHQRRLGGRGSCWKVLRVEPHSEGLRERIWWGSGSNPTAVWAAKLGLNLQSSTLKDDESGKPFHVQQVEQIELYRQPGRRLGTSGSRASRSAAASSH